MIRPICFMNDRVLISSVQLEVILLILPVLLFLLIFSMT